MNHLFWSQYAGCWSIAESATRAELLARLTAEDVAYRDPHSEVQGREAFSNYMAGFQKGFPGHRFEIERVDAHHERSLARWILVAPDGAHVQRGVSHAEHDSEGRLRQITGFFPA